MYTQPDEVREILNRGPAKLKLLTDISSDIDNLPEIQVPNIFEPNSTKFHPLGLFSEEIFGPLTDLGRFVREAQIDLHTWIIHPAIFAYVFERKALYTSIMSGKQYAIFNEDSSNFELTSEEDLNGGTGYSFFIRHLPKLAETNPPESLRARNLHALLVKYKKHLTIRKLVVIPAGLRDIDLSTGRLSKDDINRMYLSLLNLTTGLSKHDVSEDQIFDGIRYQIQLKIAEIFKYLENIGKGKKGFFQKHYGNRRIAYGTRNVATAPIVAADTAAHPTNIKSDETGVPLHQAIIAFHPFVVNFIKRRLYGELFLHGSTENIPVTNPKTLAMEYIAIRAAEMNRYTTSEGIDRILSQFKHIRFRESPVSIKSLNRSDYWLLLKYEIDDKVFIAKSLSDLKLMVEAASKLFLKDKVAPVTWVEILYLATLHITSDKFVNVVRYPITGEGSIFASKVHVLTTTPSLVADIIFEGSSLTVQHYPVLGKPYFEGVVPHQSRLSGLGADFDGDMLSITGVWTKEGNAELKEHMNKIHTLVGSDLNLKIKATMDLVALAVHNLSV